MLRKDREMDREFAINVVDKCEYAVISMCLSEIQSYCLPISIVRIDDYIYFHSAIKGSKTDILNKNPNVCLTCVGDTNRPKDKFTTEYESAIVFGKAFEVVEEEIKIKALKALCQRHNPDNMQNFENEISQSLKRTALWKISIDSISGKRKKYDKQGQEMKYGRME